jgi:hypothetical protein
MGNALADYRTRIINSLDDTTSKYTNTVLDEALRKVLNEYTRAFPNIKATDITVATAGKLQSASSCTNLIAIICVVHPWNSALANPYTYEREDFVLTWRDGSPYLFFSGDDIPQATEKIRVEYAATQTVKDLDSAAATTVRDDHEDLLIVGAAGQAAMMRASGLSERWGHRPQDTSALMLWGQAQYRQFTEFLAEIRAEQPLDIFPSGSWKLDQWDEGKG